MLVCSVELSCVGAAAKRTRS